MGRWKHLYPPEDRGKNHINASRRRSLCFAKYKTVPLQIYGNNVTGAKGCHFESKKAHFSVALMASDVKANYTPTRWERNQSQEGNIQLETHPQEFGKPALLPSQANLSQAQTKDVLFSHQEMERTDDRTVQRETWRTVLKATASLLPHVGMGGRGAPRLTDG